MSDFLGTLVARSLSAPLALPVVQPRLPSRFEPDGVGAGATFAEREVEADPRVAREPVAAHAQPTVAHAAPRPRPQPAETELPATRREARPFGDDAALPRVRSSVERDEGETPRPTRPASTPPVVTPAPRPTPRVPPNEAPVATAPRREAASDATPATPRQIETRTVVVEREHAERRAPKADAARPARVVPVVTLAPPAARSEPTAAVPSPAAAAETAPVIQVTIGRIEVRARETRAAPRERAAAGPLTSLEDYLARRRRGGGAS